MSSYIFIQYSLGRYYTTTLLGIAEFCGMSQSGSAGARGRGGRGGWGRGRWRGRGSYGGGASSSYSCELLQARILFRIKILLAQVVSENLLLDKFVPTIYVVVESFSYHMWENIRGGNLVN